jgi:hypothetical protein
MRTGAEVGSWGLRKVKRGVLEQKSEVRYVLTFNVNVWLWCAVWDGVRHGLVFDRRGWNL